MLLFKNGLERLEGIPGLMTVCTMSPWVLEPELWLSSKLWLACLRVGAGRAP